MLRRNTLTTNSGSTRSKPRYSFRLIYIFSYNLFQFCGHTWILANTITRFLTFGRDALADTFYSVGFVMSLCQLLSILEIFHIADGIERARLLPRFIQVMEKNILLIMVIMLEEIQKYPHELLSVMERPSIAMLWSRYSLWIPVYILSVTSEGVMVYQALPYLQQSASHSAYIQLPFLMMLYLSLLTVGAPVTVWQLLKERMHHLDKWYKRKKKK